MSRFKTDVVWCREKKFCVSWDWRPSFWFWGLMRQRYDGLHFWAFCLGPLTFHNDFEPEDSV